MHTKYILVQKKFIYIFTKQETKIFILSDLIVLKKDDKLLDQFTIYQKYLTQIIQNFIKKAEFKEKDKIVLLFDHPWTKTTLLNTPWLSKKKLTKIIPFEIQKKYWRENIHLQHSFYLLKNKKTKKNRAIVYSMEKQILTVVAALFASKNLNLQSIEPYTHWLEQEAHQMLILAKKKINSVLTIALSTSYANLFVYDNLGLCNIYTLPIKNNKVDQKFWNSFLSLVNRIFLLKEKNFKILLKKEKQYVSLDISKDLPSLSIKNISHTHQELLQQNQTLKLQNRYLNLYPSQFQWNFNNWQQSINFLKQKLSYQQFLFQNSALLKIRFYVLSIGIVFFCSALLTLEYKRIDQKNQNLTKKYHGYLNSYLLQETITPNLIKRSLSEKIKEWKKLKEVQKNYLNKNYPISNLLLEIARVKRNINNFQITQLELQSQKIKFTAVGDNKIRSQIQKLFAQKFLFLSIKNVKNKQNAFVLEMQQK